MRIQTNVSESFVRDNARRARYLQGVATSKLSPFHFYLDRCPFAICFVNAFALLQTCPARRAPPGWLARKERGLADWALSLDV